MPFLPSPASSPESRSITAEPGPSTAPASARPLVSAIALISVRPMRPPAPATISRMSDIVRSRLRLRAVVALDAFMLAAAHDKLAVVLPEDIGIGRRIGLVALFVVHLDAPDPIRLGHVR